MAPFKEKSEPKHKHKHKPSLYRLLTLLLLLCFTSASLLKFSSFPPQSNSSSPPPPPPPPLLLPPSPRPLSCSSLINNASGAIGVNLLCCDRTHYRTDICYIHGDIRTSAAARSILLHTASPEKQEAEKIRPYTRKWEKQIMNTVDELTLQRSPPSAAKRCDVRHRVPAVVFSTGGYTGNVYHEFNDGLIPLYITAAGFAGEVVLVAVEYHEWWFVRYRRVLEKISKYKIVDFGRDKRVHCFDEVIVGLKIHGELSIDSNLMSTGKGILDFHSLLNAAFSENDHLTAAPLLPADTVSVLRPKLIIIVRRRSRRLVNLHAILKLSHRAGFDTDLLSPNRSTPLTNIHRSLVGADGLIGVHGAAMTHFLFMRPGSVVIQVVPLGLDWAAETYYGEPARRMGLQYLAYNVTPAESSLSKDYGRNDPVLVDTRTVTTKGWAETKRIYMDKQDVEVDLRRFRRVLHEARALQFR